MDNIVEKVKEEMIKISNDRMKETNYDDWNNHIRLVYENGHKLAIERNADIEIVDLATILHDVARVMGVGPIDMLANEQTLPEKYKDHYLAGEYKRI